MNGGTKDINGSCVCSGGYVGTLCERLAYGKSYKKKLKSVIRKHCLIQTLVL